MTIPFYNTSDEPLNIGIVDLDGIQRSVDVPPLHTVSFPEGYTLGDYKLELGDVVLWTQNDLVILEGPRPTEALALGFGFGLSLVFVLFALWGVRLLKRPVVEN